MKILKFSALSRISPRVMVRVSVRIVYRIATGGYSWIWPLVAETLNDNWSNYVYGHLFTH